MKTPLKLIYHQLVESVSTAYYRFLYDKITLDDRLIGLVGARGVGKTTLMLQLIKNNYYASGKAFYFSADHVYFSQNSLYTYVEDLFLSEGINIFFIDEIHKYANWNQELKNLYDGFPNIKIMFSGSSSLDLVKGSYDLSRRAIIYQLPGMSFREYLNFNLGTQLTPVAFKDFMQNYKQLDNTVATLPKIKGHFKDYLAQGYYPFYHESPLHYYEKLLNVINKTIYEDIANFYQLKTNNLPYLRKILSFLASIPPGSSSVHNIGKNLSLDDKTITNYLIYLKETGLITLVYAAEGGNIGLRRPEKIFLNNTNIQYALENLVNTQINVGTVRELFFLQSITNAGMSVYHSKTGDYRINDVIFEIGRKNKTRKQIKGTPNAFLVKDDILLSTGSEIPLMYFGFLY